MLPDFFYNQNQLAMRKIYPFFVCILLFSCTSKIHYVGQASASIKKKVDVYISENSIKRNYDLIGQGYLNVWAAHSKPDKIQKLAEETARKKGADAVIISDFFIPNTGQLISSTYKTDSVSKATITTGNTTISLLSSGGFRVFFVK
jgi:hypothetical protein